LPGLDEGPAQCYNCTMTQMSNRRTAAARPRTRRLDPGELIEPGFFRALCDPNRVALLVRLAQCGRPCTVTEISECCPVDISVVSRHLAMLRDAGILQADRRGKEVYYRVRFDLLVPTLRRIADAIQACCPTGRVRKKEVRP